MSLQDFVDELRRRYESGSGWRCLRFPVPRKKFHETAIGYQGKPAGISLPTGGSMMIFTSSRSMYNLLDNYLEFFREESCGQCTFAG